MSAYLRADFANLDRASIDPIDVPSGISFFALAPSGHRATLAADGRMIERRVRRDGDQWYATELDDVGESPVTRTWVREWMGRLGLSGLVGLLDRGRI